ncbi:hypothetical protein [Solicola sp. PLA-1-18]|uniref:hypothetical protein n=1 Tax=Solicola sp. PLA-1-18 TaxID=3380532 RepID=UPI003B7D57D8
MTNSSRGGLVRRARTHLALTAASGLVVAGAVTGYLAIDGGTATAQSETNQQSTASTTTDSGSGSSSSSSTDSGSTSGSSGLSSTDQSGQAAGGSNAS